jgi:hypothetical protein
MGGLVQLTFKLNFMKYFVLHPSDFSTEFLKPIYQNIPDVKVITGGLSKDEVIKEIGQHDHIIMCGHGSGSGIYAINNFIGLGYMSYIIDREVVNIFKGKQITSIWCYAKDFIVNNSISNCFMSGMFVSECAEASLMGFTASQEQVDESNWCFSKNLGEHILKSPEEIHTAMQVGEYAKLANTNPVASFNFKRLGYTY